MLALTAVSNHTARIAKEKKNRTLVVWNINFIFPYIGNFIIPTDELIFFRGLGQPPTRNRTQPNLLCLCIEVLP
jgi:hypothetical protein